MAGRTLIDISRMRAFERTSSMEALTGEVDAVLAPLGVTSWFYAVDLPLVNDHPHQLRMGTYPEAWVTHYFAQDYISIDPIISHCHDHATPLAWDEAQHFDRRVVDPHLQKIRNLFDEAREFGLGAGVSVPLHGPGVSWGLMSYASGDLTAKDFNDLLPELHLLAHFVHEAARRFARSKTPTQLPALTKRERECLSWAAEGKTSWEIGQLLNISERTSIFHLQNATHKLGVSGRQAAIARAVSLGLIVSTFRA
ncbi:MAG: LuxR family transcriptional regulator [Lysobacter sp.]|nr:LuxR family transcriptional regulator [Lysobacter sp.]